MFLLGHIEHLIFHSYFMDLFMSASDILVCVFISLSCALCVRACVLLCLFLDAILFARMSDLHRAVSHSVNSAQLFSRLLVPSDRDEYDVDLMVLPE